MEQGAQSNVTTVNNEATVFLLFLISHEFDGGNRLVGLSERIFYF